MGVSAPLMVTGAVVGSADAITTITATNAASAAVDAVNLEAKFEKKGRDDALQLV